MASERVFGVLPFFHVFALTVVMNVAIAGRRDHHHAALLAR